MAAEDLVVNSATNSVVKFTPTGGGGEIVFPNSDWSISTTANVVLMVNGRDGVKRKPTYDDAPSVSVNAFKDEVALVAGTNISEGDVGVLKCYYTATKFRQLTAILESIDDSAGTPGSPHNLALAFSLESGAVTNGSDS